MGEIIAKYLGGNSFWIANKPQKCSSTWSALLECRKYLKNGCLWLIGDGSSIKVWSDPWIASVPGHTPPIPTNGTLQVITVKDLIIEIDKSWNMDLVNQLFDPFIAAQIGSIPLSRAASEDKLIWSLTNHASSKNKILCMEDYSPKCGYSTQTWEGYRRYANRMSVLWK